MAGNALDCGVLSNCISKHLGSKTRLPLDGFRASSTKHGQLLFILENGKSWDNYIHARACKKGWYGLIFTKFEKVLILHFSENGVVGVNFMPNRVCPDVSPPPPLDRYKFWNWESYRRYTF